MSQLSAIRRNITIVTCNKDNLYRSSFIKQDNLTDAWLVVQLLLSKKKKKIHHDNFSYRARNVMLWNIGWGNIFFFVCVIFFSPQIKTGIILRDLYLRKHVTKYGLVSTMIKIYEACWNTWIFFLMFPWCLEKIGWGDVCV